MNLKSRIHSAAAYILAAALLCSTAAASSKSSDVISAALGEAGYTEGAGEYSKYGQWYGLPHSYWCDMFVSWCAMTAGVPAAQFPRHCSCTTHVNLFAQKGQYQNSASRGGDYVPRQGDVIFFYNYLRYPSGSVKNHTGLVLYVEDGYVYTIEGNALANRLDLPYSVVSEARDGDLEPPDYVTVNRYPLDAPHIHGYGIPKYDDRTALELNGFVDLGRHAESAGIFQTVCAEGVMSAASSHTFAPNHGMTRGEFITLVTDFFGLTGWEPETADFDDVPADSSYYAAVMAARSAGFVNGAKENFFQPDSYISPGAAQTVLSRALVYTGLEEKEFSFSKGDYSYIRGSYTIRADIARAFYDLCRKMPLSKAFDGVLLLDGAALDWPARELNGVCYVPVPSLQQLLPAPEPAEEETGEDAAEEEAPEKETDAGAETPLEEEIPAEETPVTEEEAGVRHPVPMENTDRVLPAAVTLQNGETAVEAEGFIYRGTEYIPLQTAAGLLSADINWSAEGHRAELVCRDSGGQEAA